MLLKQEKLEFMAKIFFLLSDRSKVGIISRQDIRYVFIAFLDSGENEENLNNVVAVFLVDATDMSQEDFQRFVDRNEELRSTVQEFCCMMMFPMLYFFAYV